MNEAPTAIESVNLKEETLPSGKKVLRFIFKQKFGNYHYEWTPPWKGESGAERLLIKALEIEEWNDYDTAWSGELKQASAQVPALDEIRLPVRIRVGELVGPMKIREEPDETGYRLAVEVLSDDKRACQDTLEKAALICVGDVKMPLESLTAIIFAMPLVRGVSRQLEDVPGPEDEDGDAESAGVRFYVWLKSGAAKTDYNILGKELSSSIRSFMRKCLSDHQALKKGFDET